MDRIAKALEIARKSQPRPAAVSPARNRALRAEPDANEIEYHHTQTVPVERAHLRRHRVIGGINDRRIIDAYKSLRTRVLRRMQQNNWKTLGITSAGEHEGKTLTAVNLGISIAMQLNYSVLLVDADLRRPNVHKLFGVDPQCGLIDYLNSEADIEETLIHPEIDRFVFLPGSLAAEGSSELLASPRMVELVDELRSRYKSRLVLFDLPPVLVGDDVAAFAPYLDAVLLVVEDNKTQSDELTRTIDLMEGVEVIGTVLNKSADEGQGYDYYY